MTEERLPKRNDTWKCPLCQQHITLHVRVSVAPLCGNKQAHSTKHIEMVKIKKNRED
jgi:hypothetical protein